MNLSNYLTSIKWDLKKAGRAEKELRVLFDRRIGVAEQAEDKVHSAKVHLAECKDELTTRHAELREVSIAYAQVAQIKSELEQDILEHVERADSW